MDTPQLNQHNYEVTKKAAIRIRANLQNMSEDEQINYLQRLIVTLGTGHSQEIDAMHLIALDFAIEMTPNQDKQ